MRQPEYRRKTKPGQIIPAGILGYLLVGSGLFQHFHPLVQLLDIDMRLFKFVKHARRLFPSG